MVTNSLKQLAAAAEWAPGQKFYRLENLRIIRKWILFTNVFFLIIKLAANRFFYKSLRLNTYILDYIETDFVNKFRWIIFNE